MPKLIILILTANQDLFLNSYNELRNHYIQMGKRYNIPLSVIGYVGDSDTIFLDEETGILHLDCPDNEISNKLIRAAQYIQSNMDYDFVVKTNTSTIINLRLMYLFMRDSRVDWNKIYCKSYLLSSEIGPDKTKWFSCPSGTYAICSRKVFDTIFDSPDNINANVTELSNYYGGEVGLNLYDINQWGWSGLSEDATFGWLAKVHEIQFHSLYEDLVVTSNYRDWQIHKISTIPTETLSVTPSIICRTADYEDIDKRNMIEPAIIHMCGLLFELCRFNDKDYEEFYFTNMITNVSNNRYTHCNLRLICNE